MKRAHQMILLLLVLGLSVACDGGGSGEGGEDSGSAETLEEDSAGGDDIAVDAAPADVAVDAAPDDGTPVEDTVERGGIRISGNAFAFALPGQPYGRIAGAAISILEHPGFTATTDEEGYFEIHGLSPGSEATLVLEAAGFPEGQTRTFVLPEHDLEQVTFQIPDDALYAMLAGIIEVDLDPDLCQMVSTVTVVGKSIYDEGTHGVEGALVMSDPEIPADHGPIYFNSNVIPDWARTDSSDDGGVVFANVEPGVYVLSAEKEGIQFESVTMKCRPGVLVNASPPYGLQQL